MEHGGSLPFGQRVLQMDPVDFENDAVKRYLGELISPTTPIGSMYGIFTYIYHKNQLNVGEYTIHGSYGTI